MRRIRSGVAVGAPVLALLAVVGPAPSAQANHQYCGKDAEGVHLGGYAGETRDNGHPDGEEVGGAVDYAGVGAVAIAKQVAFALDRVNESVGMAEAIADAVPFIEPEKEIKLGFSIAKLAAGIAKTAADAVVMGLEQRNAEVDACGGTVTGDLLDTLFVARIEEELAGLASGGSPIGPPSMFVLPDDGAPEWTSETDRYDGHEGSLDIPYIDGVANDENIGVAVIVRNTIAHLEAHGINTGGGFKWIQGQGLVYQDGAKDLWWDAMRLLEDGRVRLAYAKFAEAYRMAVSLQTTS